VAKGYPKNKYLKRRGVAGTHDINLGVDILDKMINGNGEIKVPSYDESARHCIGDRFEESKWPTIQMPLDLVILEGWMLGYSPVEPDNEVIERHPGMVAVNENLKNYAQFVERLNAVIIAGVENPSIVYKWRGEQEDKLRESGQLAMSKN